MVDYLDENAVPFTPKGFASLGVCPAPSAASLHRWRLRGLRGIKLVTFLRGGRRYTTAEAVSDFFAKVTAAADGIPGPNRTSTARRRALEDAERDLDRAGI